MNDLSRKTILNLKELALYLNLNEEKIEKEALQGNMPGRKIDNQWRFLRSAIDDWLKGYDTKSILLNQAGAFSDDQTLPALRALIYKNRGMNK